MIVHFELMYLYAEMVLEITFLTSLLCQMWICQFSALVAHSVFVISCSKNITTKHTFFLDSFTQFDYSFCVRLQNLISVLVFVQVRYTSLSLLLLQQNHDRLRSNNLDLLVLLTTCSASL